MKWPDGKPYYSLNQYYRDLYGEKTYKLALDIGTTCPNRDGTLNTEGCIFCSGSGSGDYAAGRCTTVQDQIDQAIDRIADKYRGESYIAYLQSFTNTYGDPDRLLPLYADILSDPRVKGLAIGTRPDCLSDDILDGIEALAATYPIWIELGLQTIHPTSADFINRCYSLDVFEKATRDLHQRHIPAIVHVIAGLPGENKTDFLETIRFLNTVPIRGIKFHMLHILKGTALENLYRQDPFDIMDQETYCNLVSEAISLLSTDIVIHRLTGDGPKELLIEPRWTLDKRRVLNDIHKTLKARQLWQGKYHSGGTYERQ